MFGWLMDGGAFRSVFLVIAAMYAIGILSVLRLNKSERPEPAAAG